jgi:C-terminal processing protease CtpA/Prc
MSVSQGNIGAAPGFWPLKGGGSSGQMAVKPLIPKNDPSNPAVKAGLSKDHTIVAVNGQSPPLDGRELMTWFRLNFNPGDKITLTVREKDGRTRQLTYPAPASNR